MVCPVSVSEGQVLSILSTGKLLVQKTSMQSENCGNVSIMFILLINICLYYSSFGFTLSRHNDL